TRALFQLSQGGYVDIQKEWDVSHSGLHPPAGQEQSKLSQLVDIFNDLLAKIHATLAASNKAERFRADLGAFFRGATAYAELFEGIKANPDGRLPVPELMLNLKKAKVQNAGKYLHQALNELLFFLVFTVGEVIGRQEEQELSRKLNDLLKDG